PVQLGERIERVAGSLRRGSLAPDAEGTDSEFHPRLRRLDAEIHLMDQAVDIRATPIIARELSARSHIFAPAGRVGEFDRSSPPILLLVGVEVVVDVNAIDVVPAHDVHHHVECTLSYSRL